MGILCALVALGPGCAARWAPNTSQPPAPLQWPYAPGKAKLTYARSLTGLARGKSAGSLLRAILIGNEREDRSAFVLPVAVAAGRDGRIAVADMGRRCVHLYIPGERRYVQISGSKQDKILSPVGVVFDDELRLYLSDSTGKVFAFSPSGEALFTLQSAGADRLQRPTGLSFNPRNKLLYVVDTLADKVHAFGPRGVFAFSFGERGDGPGGFNFPTHISCSPAGELYVTDSLNFRVQIFDENGKVLGAFGHHGDGSGDLAMPKGVAVDRDGVVYVVDSLFDNVQLFDRQGAFLLTLGKRGIDFGEFWLPSGAFISDKDELYVCDTYNRRIQIFRIAGRHAGGAS
jgi:DNA-binding beta-propeller fold protein YncE